MDEAALRAHPLAAPFSWPVTGKRNVVATWAGAGEGRSLVLNGHVDVVPPGGEPASGAAIRSAPAVTATGCSVAVPAT